MKKILLIEDDEISRTYMAEALAILAVDVSCADSFAAAQALCEKSNFDLIISDINLSDGNLFECIQMLPSNCKKMAVSAEISPQCASKLKATGIDAILPKPMTITDLHGTVCQLFSIQIDSLDTFPLWDDEKAFAALGRNEQILQSLKGMFKTELPLMTEQIEQAFRAGKTDEIDKTLHKLKASCGFLGAKRLLQECHRLDNDINQENIERFLDTAQHTLRLI